LDVFGAVEYPGGGFSGGPVLSSRGELYGVSIEGLYSDNKPLETGFSAAVCLAPLLQLLVMNEVRPNKNSAVLDEWRKITSESQADDSTRA
jgi:hypothetical protein